MIFTIKTRTIFNKGNKELGFDAGNLSIIFTGKNNYKLKGIIKNGIHERI